MASSNIKLIQQGAEAKIFLNEKENLIIKDRIPKSYRLPELDNKIIKQRTKAEKKLLEKASKIINSPNPLPSKEINIINMPYIDGEKLSESLNNFPLEKQKQIMIKIGESLAKIHKEDIIHGDLTTSNIILVEKEVFFIDFGLGYISKKVEDKAVDLHLLRQALEAKHFQNWKILFEEFKKSYSKNYEESKQIFERITAVERRGRYRH
jgi:TP53 regulating kinase-like protein